MTWVDGGNPAYQESLRKYHAHPEDLNPERFRDPYQLLRYGLRSICEQMGDLLGNVHLVTQRPQRPEWLRADATGFRIVHHDEIFPDPSVLPTFSSNAIESCLHRIPDLSDWFLYCCDDYFLCRPVTRSDWFDPTGRPYLFGTLLGENLAYTAWDRKHHALAKFQHFPQLFFRPWADEMEAAWAEVLQRTRKRRFRVRPDVSPERLYRHYLLKHRRDQLNVVPIYRFLRQYRFHKLTNNPRRQAKALATILRNPPCYLCLNDDQRDSPHPEVAQCVRAFLQEAFPRPSPFESPCTTPRHP